VLYGRLLTPSLACDVVTHDTVERALAARAGGCGDAWRSLHARIVTALMAAAHVQVTRERDAIELVDPHGATRAPDALLREILVAWLVQAVRRLTGDDLSVVAVSFCHAPVTPAPSMLSLFLGVRVEHEAACDRLVIKAPRRRRFPWSLVSTIGGHERRHDAGAFASTVLRVIRETLDLRGATTRRVAQAIGVSERTLRRRLGESKVTLAELVERSRRHRAEELLAQSSLPVERVAERCGLTKRGLYAVFHGSHGMTPGRYRLAARGGRCDGALVAAAVDRSA
jgi:AraC-like DNA-binding protein